MMTSQDIQSIDSMGFWYYGTCEMLMDRTESEKNPG
ncbi:MAG: hypothetical protein RL632_173 [Bacteroidota bacterium]|jgi:hypothetical protein